MNGWRRQPFTGEKKYSDRGMMDQMPTEMGDIPRATRAVIDLGAIAENVSRIRKLIGPGEN